MNKYYMIKELKGNWVKKPLKGFVSHFFEHSKGLRALTDSEYGDIVLMITDLENKEVIYDKDNNIDKLKQYEVV